MFAALAISGSPAVEAAHLFCRIDGPERSPSDPLGATAADRDRLPIRDLFGWDADLSQRHTQLLDFCGVVGHVTIMHHYDDRRTSPERGLGGRHTRQA